MLLNDIGNNKKGRNDKKKIGSELPGVTIIKNTGIHGITVCCYKLSCE